MKSAKPLLQKYNDFSFRDTQAAAEMFTGLALLKIDLAETLPTIPVREEYKPRLGQTVLAIGTPAGLDHTTTRGITSALGGQPTPITPCSTSKLTHPSILKTAAARWWIGMAISSALTHSSKPKAQRGIGIRNSRAHCPIRIRRTEALRAGARDLDRSQCPNYYAEPRS